MRDSQQRLAQGIDKIYIVTKLYDIWEKIKAEYIERSVNRGVIAGLREMGLTVEGKVSFVPFRDSDLDPRVLDSANPARAIYDIDLDRMRNIFAIVGFYDGLSKDEGVSMEIGYAFGHSKPIILVVTDFVFQRHIKDENKTHIVDPIIKAVQRT
jgi:hypothetical protein